MNKPQCRVCGKKEGRHDEFGYRIGFYEVDFTVGGRVTTYEMCTKCKRLFIKGGNGLERFENNTRRRIVYIPEGARESGSSSEELFEVS